MLGVRRSKSEQRPVNSEKVSETKFLTYSLFTVHWYFPSREAFYSAAVVKVNTPLLFLFSNQSSATTLTE